MTQIAFTKGHGTGNDFVIIADPEGELDLTDEQVAALCDRHIGIGADGVLRVVRSARLPEGAAALAEEPDAYLLHVEGDDLSLVTPSELVVLDGVLAVGH